MIHTHTQRSSEGWYKIAHPFLWECCLRGLHGCWETQRRMALRVVQYHELYAMMGVTDLSMRTALSTEWPKGTLSLGYQCVSHGPRSGWMTILGVRNSKLNRNKKPSCRYSWHFVRS